jgi:hypothetical protein
MPRERRLTLSTKDDGRLQLTQEGNESVVSFDSFIEALHYAAAQVHDGDSFDTTLIFRDQEGRVILQTLV